MVWPAGVDHFGMFVMQTASGAFSQILYDNNKIWTRSYSNSTWSTWTALVRTTDTIANATKATQDSAGQTINTTYVKSVTVHELHDEFHFEYVLVQILLLLSYRI